MRCLSLVLTPACMNIVQKSHEPAPGCTCRVHGNYQCEKRRCTVRMIENKRSALDNLMSPFPQLFTLDHTTVII